ncbi:P-loop containing nucleoside triphosphate hydrolase protein, partial [Dimargaris cristalligena]
YQFPHMSFFAGAKQPSSFPKPDLPEIAFVGRSNVGKSTLVNALARTSVVRTSDKPGLTQQINFYCASRALNLVDMPGYGFAFTSPETRDGWQALVIYPLLPSAPTNLVKNALIMKVKYTLVMTKCDSVPRPMLASRYMVLSEIAQSYPHCLPHVFMVSGKYMVAINDLRKEILHL